MKYHRFLVGEEGATASILDLLPPIKGLSCKSYTFSSSVLFRLRMLLRTSESSSECTDDREELEPLLDISCIGTISVFGAVVPFGVFLVGLPPTTTLELLRLFVFSEGVGTFLVAAAAFGVFGVFFGVVKGNEIEDWSLGISILRPVELSVNSAIIDAAGVFFKSTTPVGVTEP